MKIVLTTAFWGDCDKGGMAVACRRLAELLSVHGHQVYLVAYPDNDESSSKTKGVGETRSPNVSFIRDMPSFVTGGYRPDLAEHLRFATSARNVLGHLTGGQPDLCLAFGAGLNGLFATHLADVLRIPLIVCLRGSEINLCLSDIKLRVANRECLMRASVVVGLSKELIERAREIAPESKAKSYVIPNAYALSGACSSRSAQTDRRAPVTLGLASRYLNEKKGVSAAITMLGHLVRRHPDIYWRLDLVGEVDADLLHQYNDISCNAGVQDRICWTGLVSSEQWLDRAQQWYASLQMSPFEGFSNSNAESWAAGVPVLFTNTGFFAEQLRSLVPELVFQEWSEVAQADQIADLVLHRDIAVLTNRAIEHLAILLEEKQVWGKWQNVLDQCVSRKRRPPSSSTDDNLTLAVLFHDISEQEYSSTAMPIEKFAAFAKAVHDRGFRLCSAAEYGLLRQGRGRNVILTFDDGYDGVYAYAYPVLKQFGFAATVFVLSECMGCTNDWNPKDPVVRRHMGVRELNELCSAGWEIGSHGTRHTSLLRVSESELNEALSKSRASLTAIFGRVASFAYPYGHQNELIQAVARRYYDVAFATTEGGGHWLVDRYQIRRYSADEVLTIIGVS